VLEELVGVVFRLWDFRFAWHVNGFSFNTKVAAQRSANHLPHAELGTLGFFEYGFQ
jgi:hypothetical protein